MHVKVNYHLLAVMKVFLWLAILSLAKSDGIDTPEVMEDVLAKYASSFSKDFKDVPPPMLREALRNALPKMQEQLVQFSVNMYANGKGAEGVKPNPMLIGFSMGMKRWSEYLSKIIPLLSQASSKSYSEPRNDSRCLYGDGVCYKDDVKSHPCCNDDVSCPLSLF